MMLCIQNLALLGDFIGGVIGTIISLVVAIFVWWTFKETQKQTRKNQFESIFFQMLNTLYQIGLNTRYLDSRGNEKRGDEYFRYFVLKVEESYYYKPNEINNIGEAVGDLKLDDYLKNKVIPFLDNDPRLNKELQLPDKLVAWAFNNPVSYRGHLYNFWTNEFSNPHGLFVNYIFNIIRFVVHERRIDLDEQNYLRLLTEQLTNDQLIIMYFHVCNFHSASREKIEVFKGYVQKYSLLGDLDISIHNIFNRERVKITTKLDNGTITVKEFNLFD